MNEETTFVVVVVFLFLFPGNSSKRIPVANGLSDGRHKAKWRTYMFIWRQMIEGEEVGNDSLWCCWTTIFSNGDTWSSLVLLSIQLSVCQSVEKITYCFRLLEGNIIVLLLGYRLLPAWVGWQWKKRSELWATCSSRPLYVSCPSFILTKLFPLSLSPSSSCKHSSLNR